MKTIILLIIITFATGCPTANQNAPVGNSDPIPVGPTNGKVAPTYRVYVKGLVCPACAVGLKKFLLKLSFVKSIHVNYKTGLVLIYEAQPRDKGGRELDKMRITKAVENSGYNVDRFIK